LIGPVENEAFLGRSMICANFLTFEKKLAYRLIFSAQVLFLKIRFLNFDVEVEGIPLRL
jgi:hypothetical protein